MAVPDKNELRRLYLEKRNRLDPLARDRASALIRHRVLSQDGWKSAHAVLAYVSFGSEVDTHGLIREALAQDKRVMVPLIHPEPHETPLSEIRDYNELVPGPRNILQPATHHPVDPAIVDLVLVPGLVFDRQGGRIGFGGGYFDRLLAKMTQPLRWGLAFSLQVHPETLPLHTHDVPLHNLITENEWLNFGSL